ncbi:hypothetical protein [Dethiothermospora halolimnae]|uniref:hypothetical protein n=1 Tax=Dethiothermospora halolimnae TaxID=3114390 RepID=UPI003CCBB25F
MKKLSKRMYILIITITITLGISIGLNIYRIPIEINKTFNKATIMEPSKDKIIKNTTIKINAKLHRGIIRGSILDFDIHLIQKLEGTILIDGKEYNFHALTGPSETKRMLGGVYRDNGMGSDDFMLGIYDLESILLVGTGKEWQGRHIVAPSQRAKDYKNILKKIIRNDKL